MQHFYTFHAEEQCKESLRNFMAKHPIVSGDFRLDQLTDSDMLMIELGR